MISIRNLTLLDLRGPGSFHLEGITFRNDGSQSNPLVGVTDAKFEVASCAFVGGENGLLVKGKSEGSVTKSQARGGEML